jgi:hypothetical protein
VEYFLAQAKTAQCSNEEQIKLLFKDLAEFLNVHPQLPDSNKQYVPVEVLNINTNQTRAEIISLISEKANENELALLSLFAFREMDKINWQPFIKAAMERNPVSLVGLKGKTVEEAYKLIFELTNESIYDGKRLSQPDEVWNFKRGDGVEKAFLLANYVYNEMNQSDLALVVEKDKVTLESNKVKYSFHSTKDLEKRMNLNIRP